MTQLPFPIYTSLLAFPPLTQIISGVGRTFGAPEFKESAMVISWISQIPIPSTEIKEATKKLENNVKELAANAEQSDPESGEGSLPT